jgi:hypothetical protein
MEMTTGSSIFVHETAEEGDQYDPSGAFDGAVVVEGPLVGDFQSQTLVVFRGSLDECAKVFTDILDRLAANKPCAAYISGRTRSTPDPEDDLYLPAGYDPTKEEIPF